MTRSSFLAACLLAIVSVLIFSATPSLAQKTAKACEEEWKAGKADIQKSGKKKTVFMAECRAGGATPAAAPATSPAAAPAAKTTTPAAKPTPASKATDGRQAEYARERACAEDWKADKAAGKVATGITWPKYWSDCNKRKKAMGM